jgi:hypothetical protein
LKGAADSLALSALKLFCCEFATLWACEGDQAKTCKSSGAVLRQAVMAVLYKEVPRRVLSAVRPFGMVKIGAMPSR